jgi:hypothetical protein
MLKATIRQPLSIQPIVYNNHCLYTLLPITSIFYNSRIRCGHERMVVEFTTICAISAYNH